MIHSKFFSFKILLIILFGLSGSLVGFTQNTDSSSFKIPSVDLKTLDGLNFNSSEITNLGKPIVIVFWKSCCKPNITMLDAFNEVYADWQKETGVILYAVSIDDSRNSPNIGPLVNGKSWEFNVLLDVNSDLKRAMNVNTTPHVFILNKKSEIVWQKDVCIPGEEEEIYSIIKSL